MKILSYDIQITITKIPSSKPPSISDEDRAFIDLNNLYLRIERGELPMTRENGNDLWRLLNEVYPPSTEPTCHEYWAKEIEKLPGWDLW